MTFIAVQIVVEFDLPILSFSTMENNYINTLFYEVIKEN